MQSPRRRDSRHDGVAPGRHQGREIAQPRVPRVITASRQTSLDMFSPPTWSGRTLADSNADPGTRPITRVDDRGRHDRASSGLPSCRDCGKRDQVGETLQRDAVTIMDERLHSLAQGRDLSHQRPCLSRAGQTKPAGPRDVHPHRFRLCVFVHHLEPHLSTVSGASHSSERGCRRHALVRVDHTIPDCSRLATR